MIILINGNQLNTTEAVTLLHAAEPVLVGGIPPVRGHCLLNGRAALHDHVITISAGGSVISNKTQS